MNTSVMNETTLGQRNDRIQEVRLRDRPCVTAYYDAIMNNKRLFENKVSLPLTNACVYACPVV